MDLKTVLAALNETEFFADLNPWWAETMLMFPSVRADFLDPARIRLSRAWSGFEAGVEPLLVETADRIANDPALARLAWYYYWNVFEREGRSWQRVPSLAHALGDRGGILYLLVALALVPRLRSHHQRLGVPDDITRATSRQVRCFCDNYGRAHHGRLGIFGNQIAWLRNYVRGNLYFRIGRFEYWSTLFPGGCRAFRHRRTGAVVALADADLDFNAEGFREPAENGQRPPNCWQATFALNAREAKGCPFSPQGRALRRELALPLATWRPVLAKGDPVLDMHIPAGGNMTIDQCRESLRQATEFFRRHFPERSPVAVVCSSWMFSPLLEEILPSDANLVRFARELYLYPHNSKGPAALWFVFLQENFDLKTAPRDTTLQRAILAYLETGRPWRNGSMFILTDDLPHFGQQYYRTTWSLP